MKKKILSDLHTNSEILDIIKRISKEPLTKTSHLYTLYGPISIEEAAKMAHKELGSKAKSKPGIMIIEVVLSANRNYNKVVKPNIQRIENANPDLITVKHVDELMKSMSQEDFYAFWGHKNKKKYDTLSDIIKSINLMPRAAGVNDYQLLNTWSETADVNNLSNDIIGKNKNIGVATFQHLRMAFGIDTVKPDQRVKEVLEYEFGLKNPNDIDSINAVQKIAAICNEKVYVIDQIFVNYGSGYYANNNKNISIKDVAKKLKELEVDIDVIATATKLSKRQIDRL